MANNDVRYKTEFRTQKEAFLAIKSRSEKDLKIFGKEINQKSARSYHVHSVDHFWKLYSRNIGNNRSMLYNEMIREGQPCRLYFDLEFMKKPNPYVDGINLVRSFIKYICEQIHTTFQLSCDSKNVVQLDSSTDEKFSRHLIFHLPSNKIFENNAAVGRFVKYCCSNIDPTRTDDKEKLANLELADFYIRKNEADTWPKDSFCDQGVYSKNRNFRMFLSNKFGKNNPFLLADDCDFYSGKPNLRQIFDDSLIEVLSFSSDDFLSFDFEVKNFGGSTGLKLAPLARRVAFSRDNELDVLVEEGFCPAIDCQMTDFVNQNGRHAVITKCEALKEYKCLRYSFNSKYCHRVGREHKSHTIMIVLLLRRKVFYQKCYDPDCKGFKSSEIPLQMTEAVQLELDKVENLFLQESFIDSSFPDEYVLQYASEIDAVVKKCSNLSLKE